jgi:clathrin heavy chain
MKTFTHYDRDRIGRLCEQAGLYSRAVEHFQSTSDVKRALLNTHAISTDQMKTVF